MRLLKKAAIAALQSAGSGSSDAYQAAVLATSPLAYWQLDEGSGTDAFDSSGNGCDGTHANVTWDGTLFDNGDPVPLYNGSSSYTNVVSANLDALFDLNEYTILLWTKVSNWADATTRGMLNFTYSGSDVIRIFKSSDTISMQHRSNANLKTITATAPQISDFFSLALSCSITGGGLLGMAEVRGYRNGVQFGATQTVVSPAVTFNMSSAGIGAVTGAPAGVHSGYIAHCAVWDRPIDTNILALMTF